ncbi:hypothetical protein ACFVAQ_45850, partial [Streptomyces sp. NPDC057651]|uniref:hypothetical protein n=1 Tax=Streptomyces sp. NPDC057651 TaxID=3346194 RepID=UPI00368B14CB
RGPRRAREQPTPSTSPSQEQTPMNDQPLTPAADEPEPRLAVVDGRDALAYVIVRPSDEGASEDEQSVSVEAGSRGLSKAAAAYALRRVADQFDTAAEAEGDEPIPYGPADEDQEQAAKLGWQARAEHAVGLYATTAIERDDARAEAAKLRARVAELEPRAAWLDALEAAGVDNWSGMEHAIELRNAAEQAQQ